MVLYLFGYKGLEPLSYLDNLLISSFNELDVHFLLFLTLEIKSDNKVIHMLNIKAIIYKI